MRNWNYTRNDTISTPFPSLEPTYEELELPFPKSLSDAGDRLEPTYEELEPAGWSSVITTGYVFGAYL